MAKVNTSGSIYEVIAIPGVIVEVEDDFEYLCSVLERVSNCKGTADM